MFTVRNMNNLDFQSKRLSIGPTLCIKSSNFPNESQNINKNVSDPWEEKTNIELNAYPINKLLRLSLLIQFS